MFERFSDKARLAVVGAQEAARELGHRDVGPEHLLLGLLSPPSSVAAGVLAASGLDRAANTEAVRRHRVPGPGRLSPADAEALRAFDIDAGAILAAARERLGPLEQPARRRRFGRGGHLAFNGTAKKVLEAALREATRLGHGYIGTEHVLLGLLRQQDSVALAVLRELKVDPDALRTATEQAIPKVA